jgi:hypothetical protein
VQVELENEVPPTPVPPLAAAEPPPASRTPSADSLAPAATARSGAPGGTQRAIGLAVGGVGIAALAVGGAFGIVALVKNADLRDACRGNVQRCDPANASLVNHDRSDAQAAATMSTAGLVAGGVLAIAGVIVYWSAPSRDAPRVGVGPIGGTGSLGLSVAGTL